MNKVLHIRSTIGFYGAEKVLLNLLPALQTDDYQAHVLCIESAAATSDQQLLSSTLYTQLAQKGICVYRFTPLGKYDRKAIAQIKDLLKQHCFQLVHTHDYKSQFYFQAANDAHGLVQLHHQHGNLGNSWAEKLYGLIERWQMKNANRILCVSEQQRTSLLSSRLKLPTVQQLRNATAAIEQHDDVMLAVSADAKSCGDNDFNLLMIARFTAEKNHCLAIQAIKLLRQRGVNVRLTLLGDGPLLHEITEKVLQYRLSDIVEFAGFCSSVNPWLERADALLMTSITEGMPMSMLEAMACAVPVLSTDVGEVPLLMEQASCGVIVAAEDKAIADVIVEWMNNPELAKRLGRQGRKYIETELCIQHQADTLLSIYDELIEESHCRYG